MLIRPSERGHSEAEPTPTVWAGLRLAARALRARSSRLPHVQGRRRVRPRPTPAPSVVMRLLVPLLGAAAAVLVGACGDDSKPATSGAPGAARIESNDARMVGLHEQALALRAREDYAGAIVILDELIKLEPNDLPLRFNRATVLAELGRSAEAMAIFDELLKQTPNDPQLFQNRASVLLDLGRAEEALIELDRAMAGLTDAPALRVLRADILTKLGRAQESLAELDRADQQLATAPEAVRRSRLGAQALLFRVEALEALGRAADGAAVLERFRNEFQSQPFFEKLMRERGRA